MLTSDKYTQASGNYTHLLFNNMTFNGMHIIESVYLVENGEPIIVHRMWRERLFSSPWRPWVKTRTVILQIPYRGAVQLDANTLVMHPVTLQEFKRQLEEMQ